MSNDLYDWLILRVRYDTEMQMVCQTWQRYNQLSLQDLYDVLFARCLVDPGLLVKSVSVIHEGTSEWISRLNEALAQARVDMMRQPVVCSDELRDRILKEFGDE